MIYARDFERARVILRLQQGWGSQNYTRWQRDHAQSAGQRALDPPQRGRDGSGRGRPPEAAQQRGSHPAAGQQNVALGSGWAVVAMSCCATATAAAGLQARGLPPVAPNSLASAPMSIPATAFQRPSQDAIPRTVPTQAPAEPKPDRLMRAVALVLFTYVWRLQDAFPILGKLQLPALALLGAR